MSILPLRAHLRAAKASIRLAAYLAAALALSACNATGEPLCSNGWPTKRPPDCVDANVTGCVTYGGLEPRHGFQRDHYIPLGLCRGETWCDVAARDPNRPPGPDNPGNVWWQSYPEYKYKDAKEYKIIDDFCSGRITLEQARNLFR